MDGIIYDLWATLARCIDGHYAQWSQAWDELEKKLEVDKAHTKEAQDSPQNLEEQVRHLKEQANRDRAAQCEEVARLKTSHETLMGYLAEAAEGRHWRLCRLGSGKKLPWPLRRRPW